MARALVLVLALAAALAGAGRANAELAHGMDISHWQGAVNWLAVAGNGYQFVYQKATEGTGYADPTYAGNRAGAASIGLRVGAYHFARPAGSGEAAVAANAIAQADYFVQVAQPRAGDLPPVLDLEAHGGLKATDLSAWARQWLDQVERRIGIKGVVYASPHFWKTSVADTSSFASAGNRLWVAHWTKSDSPLVPGGNWGGLGWTFWQWTDCTKIPGFARCLDGDRYNGTNAATAAIPAIRGGLPVAVERPTVLGTPQTGKLLAAVAGRWNGTRPLSFSYQWSSCDAAGGGCAPIAGATGVTFTPGAAEAGHALSVAVTASGAGGSATATSIPTVAVATSGGTTATAPVATTLPAIAGTPQVGQTLSASAGTWTGAPTAFAYQWRRCTDTCVAIDGAAASRYVVTPGDLGATISVVVTATGRGGSRSAIATATAAVAAAALPEATVGSAVSAGAGAVKTADGAAVVTWQPGTVPNGTTVSVAPFAAKLPVAAFRVGATAPLAWPLDVVFAAAPQDAVVGMLPAAAKGVWQAVPVVPAPTLPAGQSSGAYRDAAGALHVLTRTPGQIGLFEAGAWGDPRRVPSVRPTVERLSGSAALVAQRRPDGTRQVLTRLIVTSQARLQASVYGRAGKRVAILRTGSRLGQWLRGGAATSVSAEALTPGGLPLRLRLRAAPGSYRLVVRTVDPYGRKASVSIPVRVG